MHFVGRLFEALKIDPTDDIDFVGLKRAFTPEAVRRIYQSIGEYWPDLDDFNRVLEQTDDLTGFYTGSYEPEDVIKAVGRHSLYSDKIFLLDPFQSPRFIREEFNPIEHPDQYRETAIKNSFLWITLVPWMQAGLVHFIRPPTDFNLNLLHEIMEIQQNRYEQHPELKKLIDTEADRITRASRWDDRGFGEYFFLTQPDKFFEELYESLRGDFSSLEELMLMVRRRRELHPYYVDPLPGSHGRILVNSSGANYELAKRICAISGSHIITDLKPRWKEIEIDRKDAGIDEGEWAPFAKAFQNADLRVLADIPLDAALKLRKEDRLESMRLFLRRVWTECREPDHFSAANAVSLSAELHERIEEAKVEWKKIDHDLLKHIAPTALSLAAAAACGFVPAATAPAALVAGTIGIVRAELDRKTFAGKYPAGFFLGLKE